MTDETNTTATPFPDRLSTDPRSPFYNAEVLQRRRPAMQR